MKRAPYCNKEEFSQVVYLHAAYSLINDIADNTQDKEWHKKLATSGTLLLKVYNDRLDCLDPIGREKVDSRANHTYVRVVSSDEKALERLKQEKETITMEFDDFLNIVEFANWSCLKCSQGEYVQKCPFRKLLHKYNLPVARMNPNPGECEFRWDNDIRSMAPEGVYLSDDQREELDLRNKETRRMDPSYDRTKRGEIMEDKNAVNRPKVQRNLLQNSKRKKS